MVFPVLSVLSATLETDCFSWFLCSCSHSQCFWFLSQTDWSPGDGWFWGEEGQNRVSSTQLCVSEEWPVQTVYSSRPQQWTWTLRYTVRELLQTCRITTEWSFNYMQAFTITDIYGTHQQPFVLFLTFCVGFLRLYLWIWGKCILSVIDVIWIKHVCVCRRQKSGVSLAFRCVTLEQIVYPESYSLCFWFTAQTDWSPKDWLWCGGKGG